MLKRLFPTRWARIVSWTLAALAWATTVLIAQDVQTVTTVAPEPAPGPAATAAEETVTPPMPATPESGLVVLRYTPVPPPAPEVIVQTVVSTQAAAPGPARVTSSGS